MANIYRCASINKHLRNAQKAFEVEEQIRRKELMIKYGYSDINYGNNLFVFDSTNPRKTIIIDDFDVNSAPRHLRSYMNFVNGYSDILKVSYVFL
ncbi:hypothetical protein [Methylomonas sp. AM2-LC]|uniref:hypothetical protein n=1 Tax=Methylomonas sp. AM2-LC TaxID=3153301 RepID=UPI0032637AE5